MESKKENPLDVWKRSVTPEELRAVRQKGGHNSAESRRKNKTIRESLKTLLTLDIDDPDIRDFMEARGVDPSVMNAVAWAQVVKAIAGDTDAARYVRDSIGEKPTDALNLAMQPLEGKVQSMDMEKMTDAELEAIADGLATREELDQSTQPLSLQGTEREYEQTL